MADISGFKANIGGTLTEVKFKDAAARTSLASKADLASPTFTGTPKAPTASSGTNTTQIATTAFVQNAINTSITQVLNASY